MENEPPRTGARDQLAALEGAITAVKRGGAPHSPWWYWFAFATTGPAVVAFESQTDSVRRYGPVVVAALLVAAVALHTWRRSSVRPKRSMRTGSQLFASFVFTFSFIVGLQVASALADRAEAWVAAIVSFALLAVATAFFGRRAEEVVRSDATPGR